MSKTSCDIGHHPFHHGGRLHEAIALFGHPREAWLDLSTGINPRGWPVPPLPPSLWRRLPEEEDGLETAARRYYRTESILPVAGSQAAIRILPTLRPRCRVGILEPTFSEHASAWRRAGHDVRPLGPTPKTTELADLDVLVVVNPNNPTGHHHPTWRLLAWHRLLAAKGGWLVVDEAFMDCTPDDSLTSFSHRPGLIVLRSLGKFFGLAGARVGFVGAAPELILQMKASMGPWAVANPARWVATAALRDRAWQARTRQQLAQAGKRLAALLTRYGLPPKGGCPLFQWLPTAHAATLFEGLARRGILIRHYTRPGGVRFGLPGREQAWARLEKALAGVTPATEGAIR